MSDDRPTLVVSDLHLGRRGMVASAGELDELVDSASVLIANGDVAELHVDRWADAATRELERLRTRCAASGTRLIELAGNHDPELTPRRHLVLAGGGLLVTHGDAVHESLAPWSDAAPIIRARHREVLASMPEERRRTLDGIFEAAREAAKAECETLGDLGKPTTPLIAVLKPWKITAIGRFWLSHARRMARFAETHVPTARTILVGHTHRAGIARTGGRTIVNTGCFGVPGPALAAVLNDEGLAIHRMHRFGRGEARRWRLEPRSLHRDPSLRSDPSAEPAFAAAG